MTMLRQPFKRAASGWFYRSHNPNSDAFHLRPGVFVDAWGRIPQVVARYYSFREFVYAPEYRNVLTKMFGDSEGCPKVAGCAAYTGGMPRNKACALVNQCHASPRRRRMQRARSGAPD